MTPKEGQVNLSISRSLKEQDALAERDRKLAIEARLGVADAMAGWAERAAGRAGRNNTVDLVWARAWEEEAKRSRSRAEAAKEAAKARRAARSAVRKGQESRTESRNRIWAAIWAARLKQAMEAWEIREAAFARADVRRREKRRAEIKRRREAKR